MPNMSENKTIYAFIDSQNLNLGTSKDIFRDGKKIYTGWRLDFKKFRVYLKDKFRVQKAFLFIGYIKKNEPLYKMLKRFGYDLIFKPTIEDNKGTVKGNVDAEMVLYSANIEFNNYDQAVFVSGDGDFYCLYEFLTKKDKLGKIVIPNTKSQSSLLKKFYEYKVFLEFEKEKLVLNK